LADKVLVELEALLQPAEIPVRNSRIDTLPIAYQADIIA